ncbi:MAG: putative DNA binding domain-containing protein [Tannerella sp.]|jgi:predicted HTH transcriptional regulator|nr:putative DNA binding domain-containing protein [Tannerella sp.]
MNKEQLLKHLQDIEWDNFEVKKAAKELPKNSWETVSAFANTSGGWLVLGVSQHGKKFEITGVENIEKLEQDLSNTLRSRNKFNVVIHPIFKKYDFDGKKVLMCFIASSDVKPVYYNTLSNTFIRTGSGDQRASEFEINALYRNQSFGTMSAKIVEGTSIKSLNRASYNRFRDYLRRMAPELHYNKLKNDDFNNKLQIVKDGKLTYGGLLFLGKNEVINYHLSDFRVDYLEIPGVSYSDAKVRYTYRIEEQENLWEYYFVLFQRLKIYANNPLTIGEMGIGHEDTKELYALREALVNLLIHTDYFSPMKPRIRVFTNRIEFENPGSLPRPVEELLKADESLPRNPVLAKFFRIAKLCESAGYGFDRMLEWKNQTGNDVLFETTIDKTKFTFMIDTTKAIRKQNSAMVENFAINTEERDKENQKTTQKTIEENYPENKKTTQKIMGYNIDNNEITQTTTKENDIGYQKTTQKTTQKTIEENYPEGKKTTQKILLILAENPTISMKEISHTLNLSHDGIKWQINKLKSQGIIRREGADRGGKWIILKNN